MKGAPNMSSTIEDVNKEAANDKISLVATNRV